MFLFKKIKPIERVPIGVLAEKVNKFYEVKLFYTPDPFLDGQDALNYDVSYRTILQTRLRIFADIYVRKIAKKYNFVHEAKS